MTGAVGRYSERLTAPTRYALVSYLMHKGDNARDLMVSEPQKVTGFSRLISYEGV